MKLGKIIFGLITAIVFSGSAYAQVSTQRVTFTEAFNPATGFDVIKISYVAPYSPNFRLFEMTAIGAAENCFENQTFSRPRGIDQDRMIWDWRIATGTYEITWMVKRENKDTCKVLMGDANGDADVDGRDFLMWQRNYGSTAARGDADAKVDDEQSRGGTDGSVRFVSYSVGVGGWY